MPSATLLPADVVRDLGLLLSSARAVGPLDLPVTAFSLHPHEFLGLAAWNMVTVDGCAKVVLSGVPRKSEPHRLLLPPPQTQRRPHGTGLEPAGPTARPSGEAETAVVAWTPRGQQTPTERLLG